MRKADETPIPQVPPRIAAPARVAAFHTGLSAEARAAAYLMVKGYRILARRFRTPYGEIDIVARRRHLLAFVEVKAAPASTRRPMRYPRASSGASSRPPRPG
jgi:putative endonuclease